MEGSVLIIYTGGTIGMMEDSETGILKPFDFEALHSFIPEISRFKFKIGVHTFDPPIDSSNMNPDLWISIAKIIEKNYALYDGFVILHGSDTMAYTASALSFLLQNLAKPVVLTGSQLPIGIIRTDAKENLLSAIIIASAKKNGKPVVPEVSVYFEYQLYRGNRTFKHNTDNFEAFRSLNYPPLAEAGIKIKYNHEAILPISDKGLKVHSAFDTNIAILKLFPGIDIKVIDAIFSIKGIKAVIIETFGKGNASTNDQFISRIKKAIEDDIIVVNVSQCRVGSVDQGKYETSVQLKQAGVIGGYDITIEAAITKLMFLLASENSSEQLKKKFTSPICGEMTLPEH